MPLNLAINSFDDLLISDKTRQELEIYLGDRPSMEPLLLYGPFGTGKTTIAKGLPKWRNPPCNIGEMEILEGTSAQRHRDLLDSHLERLKKSFFGPYLVSLVEEVDLVPNHNQFCPLIEKLSGDVLFIFTTNYFDKVDPKLRDRCKKISIGLPDLKTYEGAMIKAFEKSEYETPSSAEIQSEFTNWLKMQNQPNGFASIREFKRFLEDFSVKRNI